MSERDPRVEPAKGDELEKNSRTRNSSRRVVRVNGGEVTYREMNFDGDYDLIVVLWLKGWRRWAKTAEVIHRADDGGAGDAQKGQK